jgi:hypothetical protein
MHILIARAWYPSFRRHVRPSGGSIAVGFLSLSLLAACATSPATNNPSPSPSVSSSSLRPAPKILRTMKLGRDDLDNARVLTDSENRRVYFLQECSNPNGCRSPSSRLVAVRSSDGSIIGVVGNTGSADIAIDPPEHRAYVVDGESNVRMVDTESLHIVRSAKMTQPVSIAVDTQVHILFVSRNGSSSISLLDGNTLKSKGVIKTGLTIKQSSLGLAIDTSRRTLFVINTPAPNAGSEGQSTVAIIDLDSHRVLRTKRLDIAGAFDVDTNNGRIVVADYVGASKKIEILKSDSLNVIAQETLGFVPGSMTLDPANKIIYLTDAGQPSRVIVLSGETLKELSELSSNTGDIGIVDLGFDRGSGDLLILFGDKPNEFAMAVAQ